MRKGVLTLCLHYLFGVPNIKLTTLHARNDDLIQMFSIDITPCGVGEFLHISLSTKSTHREVVVGDPLDLVTVCLLPLVKLDAIEEMGGLDLNLAVVAEGLVKGAHDSADHQQW